MLNLALGNLWVNIAGYVMIYGFANALATLSAHESGKGNAREMGIQLHQCIFFTLIISAFAIFLNIYVVDILILIDQPPDVSELVPKYTWPLSFGLIPYAIISSIVNFLEAQQIYDPPSYSTLLSFLFHPLLCWLFIGVFGWGIFGGGLALLIVNIISLILLVGIVRFRPVYWDEIKDSVFLPTLASLKGIGPVLKTGLSTLLLTCVEWFALEYTTMFAGWCGEMKLSAHTICLQIENIVFMFASSFGLIIQTYAGNALGESNKLDFLAICRLGPLLGFLITGGFMAIVVVFRTQVAKLFTNSEEIINLTSSLLLFNITYGIFDTAQCLFGSIMKGIGKFQVAIWASIVPYYCIGIPLSWYFAFRYGDEDIKGIWVGITIGIILINVIFVYVLNGTNLKAEMEKFKEEESHVVQNLQNLQISSRRSSLDHIDLVEIAMEKRKKPRFTPFRAVPKTAKFGRL